MRDRQLCPERRGETVDAAQARVREANPRQQRRIRHARTGGRSGGTVRVRVPGEEPVPRGLEAGEGQDIRHGPRLERDVGLQQLRHRIHAVGRDADRIGTGEQVRVHHGICRHQPFVAEGPLVAGRPALADHRVAGGFAARARRRGHGDQRHGGTGVGELRPDALEVVHDAGPGAEQAGDGLRGVQHAPAADAEDDVDPRAPVRGHGRVHHGRAGLVGHGHLARHHDARRAQAVQERVTAPGGGQGPSAGHQQHAGPVTRHDPGDPGERPGPEGDPRHASQREVRDWREGEVRDEPQGGARDRHDRRHGLAHEAGVSGHRPS